MHPPDEDKTAFTTGRRIYCYRVMPFGLKNNGATFQWMINKVFKDLIRSTMELYINNMLAKSVQCMDHLQHQDKAFDLLTQYKMKLSSKKCIFGVEFGKFLRYLVTQRGIEADPGQIFAILNMKSPTCVKEVKMLYGHFAALNQFISQSTDKCRAFFQALQKNGVDFHWNKECEIAFQLLKSYLTSPPLLSKPSSGEMLYLYLAVSESAMSKALVREDRSIQKPVYYVSHSMNSP